MQQHDKSFKTNPTEAKSTVITVLFYVQDERYVMMPWTARNDDVQDERSVFLFQTKN